MRYTVVRSDGFEAAADGAVNCSPWDYAPVPRTLFRVINDGESLRVRLRCYEENPVAAVTARNGNVCNDSCMEFFFSPSADCSNGYFNFEVNSRGVYLFDFGPDPGDGRFHVPEEIGTVPSAGGDGDGKYWQIEFSIPFSLIKKYAPSAALSPGSVIRANVYKCGKTDQPEHYGCWNPVGTPHPNYHTPEYFGEFVIE